MISAREVVVTGTGLISPLGRDVPENWENFKAGRTGIERFPGNGRPDSLQYLGKVKNIDIPEGIPAKLQSQMRFLNRGSMLGFRAAYEAVRTSGMVFLQVPRERRALYIASGDLTKVGYEFMHPAIMAVWDGRSGCVDQRRLNSMSLEKVNPFFLLESICNNAFSFLSAYFEFTGPNTSLASLSPCGGHALELASRRIMQGEADVALVVGCGNWISDVPLMEMDGLGILSRCRKGEKSYRPFDRHRDGFIAAEGGAAVFLESAEGARDRRAKVHAVIKGFGNCMEIAESRRLSVPSSVSVRSMRMALDEAGLDPGRLAFICPHGSGTRKGDRSELRSISELLGDQWPDVPICGLKPYTGHMAAASDLAEVIFGIMAAAEGIVPATLNFHQADEEFSMLNLSSGFRQTDLRCFLSTSYGILGESSSTVLEAVDGQVSW
jgi:3-oxoacyl-[acyl-carrier-protein] synthase II